MRKDKKQLIGDEIGDEQIKLFLDFEPVDATSPSLHKLIKAYRGLRIDDFERFLGERTQALEERLSDPKLLAVLKRLKDR